MVVLPRLKGLAASISTNGLTAGLGTDGAVRPVQRHGIGRNAVPRDVPEVVDYGRHLRIGIWHGVEDGVGPGIEAGVAGCGGAGLVLGEHSPCCCKEQGRDVGMFHPFYVKYMCSSVRQLASNE